LKAVRSCVQDSQYPSNAYSPDYATGYSTACSPGYKSGYSTVASSPAYTTGYYSTSRPVYTIGTAYSPAAPASRSERYWNSANRDADRDGIPNRYDRDALPRMPEVGGRPARKTPGPFRVRKQSSLNFSPPGHSTCPVGVVTTASGTAARPGQLILRTRSSMG
jgi:hypothetical protein